MIAIERRNGILEKLQEDKKVVVGELSQLYKVSEETILKRSGTFGKRRFMYKELWRGCAQ